MFFLELNMERKYRINSASSVVRMIVSYTDVETNNPVIISVDVDFFSERVYFNLTESSDSNVDYVDLEQEILAHLRPKFLERPTIPPEMLKRIAEVKSGNYGADVTKYGVV